MSSESNVLPLLAEASDNDSSDKPTSPRKPPGRKTKPQRGDKRYGRSATSNGHGLLPDVDGRSNIARRFKDIANDVLSDQGSIENCSAARKQLIRRFAAASVIAEQMEARLANGELIDIAAHAQLSSTLVRLAGRIGINRRSKDVTPTVKDYLEAVAEREEEGVE